MSWDEYWKEWIFMKKINEKKIDWVEVILSTLLVIGFAAIIVYDICKIVKLIKNIFAALGCDCDECDCIEVCDEDWHYEKEVKKIEKISGDMRTFWNSTFSAYSYTGSYNRFQLEFFLHSADNIMLIYGTHAYNSSTCT